MAYKIIRPTSHDEWLQQRTKGIGSSEVATILGLNPFDTAYQLWRRKLGIDPPIEQNDAMRAGHILEGAVATYFEEDTGHRVIKSSDGDWLAVDSKRDYLRVSPDRTYWLDDSAKHNNANKGILECKTTQLDIDADELPAHWFIQLQYQLGIMGLGHGSLAWLTRGRKFGYRPVEFDPNLYGYIVDRVDKFWAYNIVGRQEPAPTTPDDIATKFPFSVPGKIFTADDTIMEHVNLIRALKPQIDELTRQRKEAEDAIKMAMEDCDTLVLPGADGTNKADILATFKTSKASTKFDEKQFKADHGDLYAEYLREVAGSRRFLVK